MANGRAFDDAVRLAKTMPRLSVGCHVVVIDGEPVLDAALLPSIISASSSGARFRDGLKSFAVRALAGRLTAGEIEAEASAQIRKLQAAGISVSHVDTHKHTHLFPAVLRPLLRAGRGCVVCAIRNPFGPRKPMKSSELLKRPTLWTRYAEVRLLRTLPSKFRDAPKREATVPPHGTPPIVLTGPSDDN